jgi:hypothetical protein
MRITYHDGTGLVKEKVVSQSLTMYFTESGAQVPKSEVTKIDRRGGKVEGAGRKEAEKKVPVTLYVSEAEKISLQEEAKGEGCSVSNLIIKKLGLGK